VLVHSPVGQQVLRNGSDYERKLEAEEADPVPIKELGSSIRSLWSLRGVFSMNLDQRDTSLLSMLAEQLLGLLALCASQVLFVRLLAFCIDNFSSFLRLLASVKFSVSQCHCAQGLYVGQKREREGLETHLQRVFSLQV
jgi:hypothetical protein